MEMLGEIAFYAMAILPRHATFGDCYFLFIAVLPITVQRACFPKSCPFLLRLLLWGIWKCMLMKEISLNWRGFPSFYDFARLRWQVETCYVLGTLSGLLRRRLTHFSVFQNGSMGNRKDSLLKGVASIPLFLSSGRAFQMGRFLPLSFCGCTKMVPLPIVSAEPSSIPRI